MATLSLLAGLILTAIQLTRHDSLVRAAIEGLVLAAVVAIALALLGPQRTPIPATVAPQDALLVIGAVREGRVIADLRLAEPVLRTSRDLQGRLERERFFSWVPPLLAVLTFFFAVLATAYGTRAGAIISWAICLSWIALTVWIPLRRSAAMKNAQRAEDGALAVLSADFASRSSH